MNKRLKIHENELFRILECNLSIEKTSIICDVSQKTVIKWDNGHPIPAYYKTIMKLFAGIELDHLGWSGWKFQGEELISPMGFRLKPDTIEYWAIMYTPDISEREQRLIELRARRKLKTRR